MSGMQPAHPCDCFSLLLEEVRRLFEIRFTRYRRNLWLQGQRQR